MSTNQQPADLRLQVFTTLADQAAFNTAQLEDGVLSFVKATGLVYAFDKATNTWNSLGGGASGPGAEYTAQVLVSVDQSQFPNAPAFSTIQWPASNVNPPVQWRKGATLTFGEEQGVFYAGPLQGSLWAFDEITGELTYNGDVPILVSLRMSGTFAWSVVLNGDPWPDPNDTITTFFAFDHNGDTDGTGPGPVPGGNNPQGRYITLTERWPVDFGILGEKLLSFEAGLLVAPGDTIAIVNATPPQAGNIVVTPSSSTLTITVEAIAFGPV